MQAFAGRKIDILVNNAANWALDNSVEEASVEVFDSVFHPNVRGPFLLVEAALPHMTSPGGRIINISSIVGRIGSKFTLFYAGSKVALHGMTRSWAEGVAERGITVNVVQPGPIQTGYALPDEHELIGRFRAQQYTKRNGTAGEVAHAIVFLSSAGSSFVNGQVLAVDGGLSYL